MSLNLIQRAGLKLLGLRSARKRNWDAARNDRLRTNQWGQGDFPINESIRQDLSLLRARSRHEADNNPWAAHAIELAKVYIVGPAGFTLQARSQYNSGKLDEGANKAIEEAHSKWSIPRTASANQKLSFNALCRMIVGTVMRDGECFVHVIRSPLPDGGNPWRYTLQIIDAALVPEKLNVNLGDGKYIVNGVEIDQYGRPTAYYVDSASITNRRYRQAVDHKTAQRIPAADMYHIFDPEYSEATRGVPWFAPILTKLHNIEKYDEAALFAARLGASKMGFFTSPDADRYIADDEDAEAGEEEGPLITEVEPGLFDQLPDGTTVETFDPAYPTGEHGPFIKWQLRAASAGLRMSYNHLANDLEGVNYTSLRAGFLQEQDVWRQRQDWFRSMFLDPHYEDWLPMALLTKQITLNGGNAALDVTKEDKYMRHVWIPRSFHLVDPLKDRQAQVLSLEKNLSSPSETTAEGGSDPVELWDTIQRDAEAMAERGLATPSTTTGGSNANANEEPSQPTPSEAESTSQDGEGQEEGGEESQEEG